jgi:hypothetical protein
MSAEEMHPLPKRITPQTRDAKHRMSDAIGDWQGTVDQIIETPARIDSQHGIYRDPQSVEQRNVITLRKR